jgi:hypothetical protein
MKTYFLERCTGGAKNVNFWKTVKPFFSKKCNSGDQNIILCEVNKIINDTCEVSEKFNSFFSTVADKIGENIVYDPAIHPSIVEIKNHVDVEKNFEFQHITSDKIEKIIDKTVFTLNFLLLGLQVQIFTGPNLKTTLMTINSNHQNSRHDDVPNIMWTCQLCIREDQNASKKKQKDTLFWIHVYINLLKILKSYCQ